METRLGQLDYPRLDAQIQFNFRKDLDKAIGKLGFKYISEAVAKLYYGQGLSCNGVASFLETTRFTVNRWMASWGMDRRPVGGFNKSWTYSRFCIDCGCDTVKGYRAKGRCWPCYIAYKMKSYKTT